MTCELCPIHLEGCRTNCMPGYGEIGCIVLLGEAPGADEDKAGRPFVGKAGKALQALLEDLEIQDSVYYTNVCRCRPKENRTPKIAEIRICRDNHLLPEMKRIKPKLIIAMGNTPGKAMSDDDHFRVTNERGKKSTWHGIPVFHTYHPSAIIYDRTKLEYWVKDFKDAVKWYRSGCGSVQAAGYVIRPWNQLSISDYHSTGNVAVDVETTSLDPYGGGRVVSIAASPSPRVAYYTELRDQSISEVLENLKGFSRIICHNVPFDMAWLTKDLHYKHWIWHQAAWEDTMLLMQFKDERYPNMSLSHLAWVFAQTRKIKTPDYVKTGFPAGWDTPENRKELRHYNVRDAIATIRLYERLYKEMPPGHRRCYNWVSENFKLAIRMRHNGIRISSSRLRILEEETLQAIRKVEPKLQRSGVNLRSTDALKQHVFGTLRLPVISRTKKTKAPQLTKQVLNALEPLDKTGWIKLFKEYKSQLKLKDDYIPRFRKAGKFSHPRVFISQTDDGHGADTGRVTCEGFVNLPREGGVKKCVVSRYGADGTIISADGSQMEMRVLANESNDEVLLSAFRRGLDLHSYTASQVFGVKLEEVTKEQRQLAKTVNFGIVYGQTAFGLSRTTGMAVNEAQHFLNLYFQRLPGVRKWLNYMKKTAVQSKMVYSPTGRPFHLPNAIDAGSKDARKATNSPIQEAANAFNVEAAKQLQKYVDEMHWRIHVVLMVYDSIVIDAHNDDWKRMPPDWAPCLLVECTKEALKERLGWNIHVPIVYDVATGKSYGDCK